MLRGVTGPTTQVVRGSGFGGAGSGKPKPPKPAVQTVPSETIASTPTPPLSSPAVTAQPHATAVQGCETVSKLNLGEKIVTGGVGGVAFVVGAVGGLTAMAQTGVLEPLFNDLVSIAAKNSDLQETLQTGLQTVVDTNTDKAISAAKTVGQGLFDDNKEAAIKGAEKVGQKLFDENKEAAAKALVDAAKNKFRCIIL
jgi:hypothetical protein